MHSKRSLPARTGMVAVMFLIAATMTVLGNFAWACPVTPNVVEPPPPPPDGGSSWGKHEDDVYAPKPTPPDGGSSWGKVPDIEQNGGAGGGGADDGESEDVQWSGEPASDNRKWSKKPDIEQNNSGPQGAVVLAVTGNAQRMVVRDGTSTWARIKGGEYLDKLSIVRTGLGGSVRIKLPSGGQATVGSATKMGIAGLGHAGGPARFTLRYGSLRLARIGGPTPPQMYVQTPRGAVSLVAAQGGVSYGGHTGLRLTGPGQAWQAASSTPGATGQARSMAAVPLTRGATTMTRPRGAVGPDPPLVRVPRFTVQRVTPPTMTRVTPITAARVVTPVTATRVTVQRVVPSAATGRIPVQQLSPTRR